jgi:hypothetical protein
MPEIDKQEGLFFERYYKAVVRKYFPILPRDTNLSTKHWLDHTDYPQSKKDQFMELAESTDFLCEKDLRTKSFIKNEGYDSYKAPRPINSYSDRSKVLLGPVFHAIDQALYKALPQFVKGMDVSQRPKLVQELFGLMRVMCTDATSMEAHHREKYAEFAHYWMTWIAQELPIIDQLDEALRILILGTNVTEFKNVTMSIPERLMSGAMWTSSMNGAFNLVSLTYMVLTSKYPDLSPEELADRFMEVRCLVEGDDGICEHVDICPNLISRLGMKLKFEFHNDFSTASFCGIVVAAESMQNLRDPYKALAEFPVLDAKWAPAGKNKHKALIRAKALSYLHAHPACPVVTSLARFCLRVTSGYNITSVLQHFDSYHIAEIRQAMAAGKIWEDPPIEISMASRITIEQVYGMPVEEQLRIENYLDAKTDYSPIEIDVSFPPLWQEAASTYIQDTPADFLLPKPFYPAFLSPDHPFKAPKAEQRTLRTW